MIRLLFTWTALAVAMSANGILRELALKRVLRPETADMTSAVIGVALIGAVTAVGFRPLRDGRWPVSQLALVSLGLVALTVAFETALGRILDHKSWDAIVAHYAVWRGELWPVVLAWLACMPFLWGRAAQR